MCYDVEAQKESTWIDTYDAKNLVSYRAKN